MGRSTAAPTISGGKAEQSDALHTWRVSQLVRLGLATQVADAVADQVDWHDVANLVRRGCPASLALAIIE